MAEALGIVGIVANIIQIIDFGSQVLKRLKEYQSKLKEIPEVFYHIKAKLAMLLDALQQIKAAIDTRSIQNETKKAFLPAIKGCKVQIELLDNVIVKALPAPGDSWARKSRKALRSLQYNRKVEKITVVVQGYIQVLIYHTATSSSLPNKFLAGIMLPLFRSYICILTLCFY